MRIAFLCNNIFGNGGVQRVLTTIANSLCNNYDVHIICTNINISIDFEKYGLDDYNIKIHYSNVNDIGIIMDLYFKVFKAINKFTGFFNTKYTQNLLPKIYYPKKIRENTIKIIEEINPDVVIGCEGYYSMLLAVLKNQLKCKVIGWEHSSFDVYLNNKYQYYWNRDWLFKRYSNLLDEHIVLTKYDKVKFKEKLGVNAKFIYNPISFKSNIKSNLKEKNILAAGRFTRQKGFDNLIKAFKIMSDKLSDWNLILCGDGEEKQNLVNLINELNLEKKVKLLGFTNNLKDIMLEASIYAMPSRGEGFGLVVTEALEIGLPVVSFNTTGPSEILGEYECGLIAEQGDIEDFAEKLMYLAKDYKKRKKYSKRAIKRAKDFYEECILEEWEKVFKG